MNFNNQEFAVEIGKMASEVIFGLTMGEIIQIVIALILLATLVGSIITIRSNTNATRHSTRPVVGAALSNESVESEFVFDAVNFMNADAIGLVHFRLFVKGTERPLNNAAYEGKEIWFFPARQSVRGHVEFSGILKGLEVLGKENVSLELLIYFYYKAWSRDKKEIKKGKKYYSPAQKWHYKRAVRKWIPDITSSTQFIPPEPDWNILEKPLDNSEGKWPAS